MVYLLIDLTFTMKLRIHSLEMNNDDENEEDGHVLDFVELEVLEKTAKGFYEWRECARYASNLL